MITGAFATRSDDSFQRASSAMAPAAWKHKASAKHAAQRQHPASVGWRGGAHCDHYRGFSASSPTSATCR